MLFDKAALKVALGGIALQLEDAHTLEGVKAANFSLIDALDEYLCADIPNLVESTKGEEDDGKE